MKATTKRLVGILLAMAMVLAMMPMAVSAEAPTTLYLQPNSNWMQDGARFAAVLATEGWGTQIWVDVLDTDGDGLYELNIPQDGNAYAIVIFCRMNPNAADNNWNNKWNQSADLNVPTDNKIVYVVDGWDKSGQWIEKGGEVEEVEAVYYLRGTLTSWDTTETALTNNGDGTYSITIALAAGSYEYKISDAGWGTSWPAGANATLTVYSDCDVTFVLNTADGSITVTGDGLSGEPLPEPEYNYYVAGSADLCNGIEWAPGAAENMMTLNEETGLYEITLGAYAGTYEYKITTGSWSTPSYGYGNDNLSVKLNVSSWVTITFNPETKEVGCSIEEWGESAMKWQLNADASADDESVDLRLVTYVESLDYTEVEFYATINGVQSEAMLCTTVYESINASGKAYTCNDLFGCDGYLVTYTIEDLPAEYYDAEIIVEVLFTPYENEMWSGPYSCSGRTIVVSDAF